MRKSQGSSFLPFLSALVLAAALLLAIRADRLRTVKTLGEPVTVAIEHDRALTLTVTQSTGKENGIVEFATEGSAARISTPVAWERREVRGAPMEEVTSDPPAMGYTRWNVPAGATVSFWVEGSPPLTIRHASDSPLLIVSKRVNIATGSVDEHSILLQDGTARLW